MDTAVTGTRWEDDGELPQATWKLPPLTGPTATRKELATDAAGTKNTNDDTPPPTELVKS